MGSRSSILAVALALGLRALAAAHTLQITGVTLRLDKTGTEVTVVAHLPMLGAADPATEIPRRLQMQLDGRAFLPTKTTLDRDPTLDTVTWTGRTDLPAGSVLVASPIFPEHPEDTTIVLTYRDGALIDRAALSPAHPTAVLGENAWAVVRRFIQMGVMHILSGPDHLLFLIGLILAGGTARRLLAIVTAFTLSHSLTLSLTALGFASLPSRLVEPMIALSIVVIGLENLLRRQTGLEFRIWLSFGFGFFHGFGFAGALAEVGLPRQALGWSLAAFNVGVEIGQACILLLVLPLLMRIHRKSERAATLVTRFASIGITLAGVVWLAGRVWVS